MADDRLAVYSCPLFQEHTRLQAKRRGEGLTQAETSRHMEVMDALIASGLTLSTTVEIASAGPPPKGCVLGADGIIRSAPGVFERQFADASVRQRYTLTPPRLMKRSQMLCGTTTAHRQTRTRRRVVRCRALARHGPPRRSDDSDPDLDPSAAALRGAR